MSGLSWFDAIYLSGIVGAAIGIATLPVRSAPWIDYLTMALAWPLTVAVALAIWWRGK